MLAPYMHRGLLPVERCQQIIKSDDDLSRAVYCLLAAGDGLQEAFDDTRRSIL